MGTCHRSLLTVMVEEVLWVAWRGSLPFFGQSPQSKSNHGVSRVIFLCLQPVGAIGRIEPVRHPALNFAEPLRKVGNIPARSGHTGYAADRDARRYRAPRPWAVGVVLAMQG